MRRSNLLLGVVLVSAGLAAYGRPASADGPGAAADAPAASSAPPPVAPAPAAAPGGGLAVVALAGATEVAWPLAQGVYADATIRPAIDEAHARVLCGEAPAADAPPDLKDLAESVAAIHGDDAPSRLILESLVARFSLRGVVVVRVDGGHAVARVYLPGARVFDAATYAPDDAVGGVVGAGTVLAWSGAVHSLARAFGPTAPPAAPPLATREAPKTPHETHKAFYESGWFWGALGAAAIAGGTAFLVSRDSSPSTIHLEVQVPH